MSATAAPTANPTDLRVADPGIRALFGIEARWQAWLDVEAALALAEAELGMVPQAAAEEIAAKARLELMDRAALGEGFRRTAHQLVPLVWELARVCEGDAGKYVHWGATTQNIVQTGDLLLLRRVHDILLGQIGGIFARMADIAEAHAETALPGRTHGQHAVPTTFGAKVAVWIDEFARHVERLRGLEGRTFVAMLGGAAGTLASFGGHGFAVQARLADRLGMGAMAVPSRAQGDHFGEYVAVLALMAATAAKAGREVYTGMKQEFGELEEPVPPGTVGSSTMPQKRNPFLSQDIVVAAAQVRAALPLVLEGMQTEHEADRATSMLIRRGLEQACVGAGDMLSRLSAVLGGLEVRPARMRANLDLADGLIMAEPLMLALGETLGRQEAHDLVYEAAQAAARGEGPFRDLLAADPRIAAGLDRGRIDILLDPERYVGEAPAMARRQADAARSLSRSLPSPPR